MDAVEAFIAANQAIIGLVILAVMFAAFVLERYPATVVAILAACAFLLIGALDEHSLFSVFANPAPIIIGAMFIISGALLRTGTIDAVAGLIVARATRYPRLATIEVFVGAFIASAFMNNTPVVMVLIPIVARLAQVIGTSPTRLLMPLSFVAIMGGMMTLIGTSTNLIVDSVATKAGLAPLGIFEIAPYGLAAALAGSGTLLLLGRWLLPRSEERAEVRLGEEPTNFLTELIVPQDSDLIGRRLRDVPLLKRGRIRLLALKRGGRLIRHELSNLALQSGDHIVVRVELEELLTLRRNRQFELGLAGQGDVSANAEALVEATISPAHPGIGRRLADIPFLGRLGVRILGITRHRHLPGPDLPSARLRPADRLLVTGSSEAIRRMYENPHLLGVGATRSRAFRRNRAPIAVAALASVVALAAFDILPIGVAAVLAVGVILLARCIDAEEAWGAIDGNVLVLIFAMLAVGLGLEQTGSVDLVVREVSPLLRQVPPWGLVFAVYGLALLLTEIITNNAVAVLVTPIVIELAASLGVDPRPLVLAVMMAASASFATPIGYQTNTLVYAAGNYRFADFLKVGIPMNIIVGLVTCLAIAMI